MTLSPNLLSCSSRVHKLEIANVNKGGWLVATDSKTAIFRMKPSVLLCTVNVWPVCVCVHVVKHSCGAKGFSCRRGYFPVRCMPLVDQGGLFLGSENFGLRRDGERKKKRNRERTTMVWNAFFQESNSGRRDCGAELCLSKQTT